jgi:hypothetical protein
MFIDKIKNENILERRKLEAKTRIVFFLIHQIKNFMNQNYNQQMSHQNSKENLLAQIILEK